MNGKFFTRVVIGFSGDGRDYITLVKGLDLFLKEDHEQFSPSDHCPVSERNHQFYLSIAVEPGRYEDLIAMVRGLSEGWPEENKYRFFEPITVFASAEKLVDHTFRVIDMDLC